MTERTKPKQNKRDATSRARIRPTTESKTKTRWLRGRDAHTKCSKVAGGSVFTCGRVSGFQLRGAFEDLTHHLVQVHQHNTEREVKATGSPAHRLGFILVEV